MLLICAHLKYQETKIFRGIQCYLLSRVQLFATPWTVAGQAPLSMKFSQQEYWSVLPFSSPGDLPDPGIEPGCPELQADSLPSEPPGKFVFIADCIFVQHCIFVLHLLYPFIY